jgi:hypothetical protein
MLLWKNSIFTSRRFAAVNLADHHSSPISCPQTRHAGFKPGLFCEIMPAQNAGLLPRFDRAAKIPNETGVGLSKLIGALRLKHLSNKHNSVS